MVKIDIKIKHFSKDDTLLLVVLSLKSKEFTFNAEAKNLTIITYDLDTAKELIDQVSRVHLIEEYTLFDENGDILNDNKTENLV